MEALKKDYTPSKDNRKLNNLTAAEHEVAKVNMFLNNSGTIIDGQTRRKVHFFYPTMSDKTTMLSVQALSQELKLTDGKLSEKNLETLFQSTVMPEINRIAGKQTSTVKGYEPDYFYFMKSLNELVVNMNGVERNLIDLIKDDMGFDPIVKKAILTELSNMYDSLVEEKLEDWESLGIASFDKKGGEIYSFLDKEYMKHVAKGTEGKARIKYAASDFVLNSLIANAEAFTLFAGDPALYAKFKKGNTLEQNLEATFINIGKRLAGDIAPGMELANSADSKYYQVFFKDPEFNSSNVTDSVQEEYFSNIMTDFKSNYSGIEGADAQEYTTWKEHLHVMRQLGRLTTKQFNDFTAKLNAGKKLSHSELGTILQPMKPVYVGNQLSISENVDRRVYIKSSSFPLIPQLTAGLQIDKVRSALETFEKSLSKEVYGAFTPTVRASFGTANKVGAIKNSVEIFSKDGSVKDNLVLDHSNTLLLDRKNFRIQQDVPYKREKDAINVGTQERKLLFVNILDTQVDKDNTGQSLKDQYDENYRDLFVDGQEKLASELGLVSFKPDDLDISTLLVRPETSIFDETSEVELSEEDQQRKDFIDVNFDTIVEKLIKSKVNVFFKNEKNESKKCD